MSGLGAVFLRISLIFFRFRCSDFESQFNSFCVGAGDIETPAESLRQSTNDNEIDSTSSLFETASDNEYQEPIRPQDKLIRAFKKCISTSRTMVHAISPNPPTIPTPFVVQTHSTFLRGIGQTEKERLVMKHPAPLDWDRQKAVSRTVPSAYVLNGLVSRLIYEEKRLYIHEIDEL